MNEHARVGKRLAKTERRMRLLAAVKAGKTVAEAAAEEGIHPGSAQGIIAAAIKELARQNESLAEHVRDLELARLDSMHSELWPLAQRRDAHVFCQGCGSTAPTAEEVTHKSYCGEPTFQFVPASIDVKVHDRLLRISERRAKLIGLDAPQKVRVEGEIDHKHQLVDDNERQRLESAWRRRQADAESEAESIALPVGD